MTDDKLVYERLGELTAEVRSLIRSVENVAERQAEDRGRHDALEKRVGKLEHSRTRLAGIATAAISVAGFLGAERLAAILLHR